MWIMSTSSVRMNAVILLLCLTLAAISLTHCDAADRSIRLLKGLKHRRNMINKNPKKLKMIKHFDLNPSVYSSNAQHYSISSPLSLPPYESLAPISLPENNTPYCVYPPPSTIPTPIGFQPTLPSPPYYSNSPVVPIQNPPPSPTTITPGPPENLPTPTPETVPSPPTNIPGSPEPVLNPPIIFPGPPESSMSPPESSMSPPYFEPTPPYFEPTPPSIPSPGGGTLPSPPSTVPSPSGGTVPSPSVFQPPVVYPPPSVPPPPNTAPQATLWCVAKPSVPDPIVEEAMNYACWSGADCTSIQPNGACYQPNTVFAHASYAFNSYWQRTKASGGTCEFGGTAMLVAVDPSYDGCHFIYN